jgi:UDP-N-acetylglucosamine--dolichyl-phosphate N-acetylglucosaminephosphotransferase
MLVAIISFVCSIFLNEYFMHYVIEHLRKKSLFLPDLNKVGHKRNVPALGGVASVGAFFIMSSILIAVAVSVGNFSLNYLLLSLLSLFFVAFIGLVDDVLVFPIRMLKPVLVGLACIPIISANFSQGLVIHLPFIGNMHLGIYYALLLVPLAIVFASNAVNILAGIDGLVPALASVAAGALWILAYMNGNMAGFIFFSIFLPTQMVLFYFNKPPSRVFPGNIGTLFAGAALAVGALIADAEQAFVILMIPYFIHFILYSKSFFSKMTPKAMGKVQKNGTLKCPYDKCYGLTHLIMKYTKQSTEENIMRRLVLMEMGFAVVAVALELFKIRFF